MKTISNIVKYAVLLVFGGAAYCGIEYLYRGHSHWTMFLVGGFSFIFCGLINELFPWDMSIWKQMAICAAGITLIEFLSGVLINLVLGWRVWDYSNMPLNILGQVCLPFTLAWFALSFVAIVLDDWLRYWLFNEEKPRYNFKWR